MSTGPFRRQRQQGRALIGGMRPFPEMSPLHHRSDGVGHRGDGHAEPLGQVRLRERSCLEHHAVRRVLIGYACRRLASPPRRALACVARSTNTSNSNDVS